MKTTTGIENRMIGKSSAACLLALWMGLPVQVLAGNGSGTTGAEFLKIGVGARALAMGGAFAAVADDAHAVYWNPAAAVQIEGPRLDASYNNLYQDANQGFVGYSHPVNKHVWSGALDYLQISSIERRLTDTAKPDYTFTSRDSAFILSYAQRDVLPNLALGVNLKYIQSYLDSASAQAYAADLGAFYRVGDGPLSLGASMVNMGTDLTYVNAHEPLPLGFKLGAAYRLMDNKLLLALGMDSWIRSARQFGNIGAEYKPVDLVALRVGYQLGHGQDQLGSNTVGIGAGIGLQFKGFNLDYAYLPYGDLGNTQRFSLGFQFGASERSDKHPILQKN